MDGGESIVNFDIGKEIWSEPNVFVYGESLDLMYRGILSLIKKDGKIFVLWKQLTDKLEYNNFEIDEKEDGWNLVDTIQKKPHVKVDKTINDIYINISNELKSLIYNPGISHVCKLASQVQYPSLKLILKPKDTLQSLKDVPVMHFHNGHGSITSLIRTLHRFIWLQRKENIRDNTEQYILLDHHSAVLKNIKTNREKQQKSKPFSNILSTFSRSTNFVRKEVIDRFFDTKESKPESFLERISKVEAIPMFCDFNFDDKNISYAFSTSILQKKSKPITLLDFEMMGDENGRILDKGNFYSKIYEKGIESSVRAKIWMLLLNFYPLESSIKEREQIFETKKNQYFAHKLQWQSFTPDQESNFSMFSMNKSLIEKDVIRADKENEFYKGSENKNSQKVYEILMTYMIYNFDLGYVQGMSDLLTPIYYLFQDEVIAFWCFVGIMKNIGDNFLMDQSHTFAMINSIAETLKFLWPLYYDYLCKRELEKLYFCFPWILINFKRMFDYESIFVLWEKFFTQNYCINYAIFLSAALIGSEREFIIKNNLEKDEIIAYFNKMDTKMNVHSLIHGTEEILIKLQQLKYVPSQLRELLILNDDLN